MGVGFGDGVITMLAADAPPYVQVFESFIDAEKTWTGLGNPLSTLVYRDVHIPSYYDIGLTIGELGGENIRYTNTAAWLMNADTRQTSGTQSHLSRYAETVGPGIYRAGVYMHPDGNGYTKGNFKLEIRAVPDDGPTPVDLGDFGQYLGNPYVTHGALTPNDTGDHFRFTLPSSARIVVETKMSSEYYARLFSPADRISVIEGGGQIIGREDGVTTYELTSGTYIASLGGLYHDVDNRPFVEYDAKLTLLELTPGELFTSKSDIVDFNKLDDAQLRAVKSGAPLYDALGGNDQVTLPQTVELADDLGFALGQPFSAGSGTNTIIGSPFADTLLGGSQRDFLYGDEGQDTLRGGSGKDELYAGNPDNFPNELFGEEGEDTLYAWNGQTQRDFLSGGADRDTYFMSGLDEVEEFQPGETAYYLGGKSMDWAVLYSTPAFSQVNFFNQRGSLGKAIFGNDIDIRDLKVEFDFITSKAAKITYERDAEAHASDAIKDFVREFKRTACILKPVGEEASSLLLGTLVKRVTPGVVGRFKGRMAVWLDEPVTSKRVEAAGKRMETLLAEVASKLAVDLVKGPAGKALGCQVIEPTAAEVGEWTAIALQVVFLNKPYGMWLKLGGVTVKTGFEFLFQNLDREFEKVFDRERDTGVFYRVKPGAIIDVKPSTIVTPNGKISVVTDAATLTPKLGSKGTDTIFSPLERVVLPRNVENGVLLPDRSAERRRDGEDAPIQTLIGNALNNELVGNSDANRLAGLGGSDELFGGAGADILIGGKGADRIHAGVDQNRDLIVFADVRESGTAKDAADTVFEFRRSKTVTDGSSDRIDLHLIDADPRPGDQLLRFVTTFASPAGSEPAGQVRLVDTGRDVKVEVDADGDNQAEMTIRVKNVPALTVRDLVL